MRFRAGNVLTPGYFIAYALGALVSSRPARALVTPVGFIRPCPQVKEGER
jgi:hypothetical protein